MSKFIDLTGQKFGRWTVIGKAEDYISPKGNHNSQWLCKCDCDKNTIKPVIQTYLTSGRSKSCGCLKEEKTSKRFKKYNKYNLSGEYGVGYTTKGEQFLFDLEDYDKIKNYCWYINKSGYICANTFGKDRTIIYMHKMVYDAIKTNYDVDHIHSDKKYDNRKSNLRKATHSQNMMNRKIQSNNTSGVTGVRWDKTHNKWVAAIKLNRKTTTKYFDNFNDAVMQRKKWENEHFGEFSYDNSQTKEVI